MARTRIVVDLKPTFSLAQLIAKLPVAPPGRLFERAVRSWKLSTAAAALLREHAKDASVESIAALAKEFPIDLLRPRPIAEAISSAGGVAWAELNGELMLKRFPGIFCAGEMIDWEAPTGGYLLQGCFSTATRAAQGLTEYLK